MFHFTMSASDGIDNLFLDLCFWVNVFFDGVGLAAVVLVSRSLSLMGWVWSVRE